MRLTYKDGSLNINLQDVLEVMTHEDKLALAESLAIESSIIEFVAQQIIDGWTKNGDHGYRGWSAEPYTALDKAIREVANKSGDVAKKEIESLSRLVKSQEEQTKTAYEKLSALEKKYNQLLDDYRTLYWLSQTKSDN